MADFALLVTQARTARKAQEWSPGDRVEVKGFDAIGTIRYCKTSVASPTFSPFVRGNALCRFVWGLPAPRRC